MTSLSRPFIVRPVATVLLKTACERTAAAVGVTPDIRYHIPHRIREGYGMRESRIADAAAEGVRLVVSVDTGIRAHAAAEEAARLGLDLIVTDHHLPDHAIGVHFDVDMADGGGRLCQWGDG